MFRIFSSGFRARNLGLGFTGFWVYRVWGLEGLGFRGLGVYRV